MKIATWNIERPNKYSKKNQAIIDCLQKVDADILILTETNEFIKWEKIIIIITQQNWMIYYTKKVREE